PLPRPHAVNRLFLERDEVRPARGDAAEYVRCIVRTRPRQPIKAPKHNDLEVAVVAISKESLEFRLPGPLPGNVFIDVLVRYQPSPSRRKLAKLHDLIQRVLTVRRDAGVDRGFHLR